MATGTNSLRSRMNHLRTKGNLADEPDQLLRHFVPIIVDVYYLSSSTTTSYSFATRKCQPRWDALSQCARRQELGHVLQVMCFLQLSIFMKLADQLQRSRVYRLPLVTPRLTI